MLITEDDLGVSRLEATGKLTLRRIAHGRYQLVVTEGERTEVINIALMAAFAVRQPSIPGEYLKHGG